LRGLVIDEIASIRNWNWLWSEVLRPTLTDYAAPCLFISTPKGYNHFYELYEQGQGQNNYYKSRRFTSYDNPYIQKEEIDHAKEELTEDTFQQEYMADFRKYTGLVYKEFNRETHVIEPFDIPSSWSIYRTFDWGDKNPTVCLWVAVDGDDNWFIASEFSEPLAGRGIDYVAGVVNAHPLSKNVVQSFADPSGSVYISDMGNRGKIFITPATRETGTSGGSWVLYKIARVAEKLKITPGHEVNLPALQMSHDYRDMGNVQQGGMQAVHGGKPSIFVFSSCPNIIREFETYRWREKSVTQAQDLNEPDVPEKANDHAMDAISYFAVSYKGRQDKLELPATHASLRNWSLSDDWGPPAKSFRIGQ